ncbi:MAG: potassium-transporting ATPase subunit KdpC [Candidatus Eremiobacteraeota bacterium]|nr:potassium-transporting ATPase subunit KdpC [Candidatus Eremiobacteraeota bacterium]MBV8365203.1 potassium-transporting ATPase subunit KdpC [Candidatus Eremiobacteraeota bacterium]
MNAIDLKDNTLRHLRIALVYTIVSVIAFGLVYPFLMTGMAMLIFPRQANGSIVFIGGKPIASALIGQLWTKPQYFHGRPSAAGKGYDPTSTGGTNLAPTSKKLVDTTRQTIAALRKENPDATLPIPMDLVTSSGSGIDPDISPEAAHYQAPRVARARGMTTASVDALIDRHVQPRTFGMFGEPRVNVLELNLALDAQKPRT